MFNPPTGPTNGAEYTYGNVVWQYQNPPGVWNIKDGTLVGTDGVGVSGFRLIGNDLYFHYVYPGGVTSSEINLGTVVGAGTIDGGLTFNFPFNNSSVRVSLGETVNIQATGSVRAFVEGDGKTIRIDNRIATVNLTGVASYNTTDFTLSTAGRVSLNQDKAVLAIRDSFNTSDTWASRDTIRITGGNGIETHITQLSNSLNQFVGVFEIRGITASYTNRGIASFRNNDFVVVDGAVSLTGNIVNSVNGKTGSVALPLANTSGTTGVASFKAGDFTVSTAGEVGLTSNVVNRIQVGANSLTGNVVFNGTKLNITTAGPVVLFEVPVATLTTPGFASTMGVASFNINDFSIDNQGVLSITSGAFVRQINGATGNLLVGAGDDKIVFTNPTGLTTSPNFVFDGRALTFGGANTSMTVTGPTFAFGDLTKVKGGVYTMFSEQATAWTESGSNTIQIDLEDGTIQKVKKTNASGLLTVTVGSGGWSNVPDTVQSVVVYVQQIGTGYTGQFHSSIIADRRVPMFGVTGGIDVFTISRYAVTNSTGLTMGFSIAVGLTGSGIAF